MSRKKYRQHRLKLTQKTSLVVSIRRHQHLPLKAVAKNRQQSKNSLPRGVLVLLVLTVGLHGSLYFGAQAVGVPLKASTYTPQKPIRLEPKEKFLTRSEPKQLRIPSVNINSPVEPVELANDKITIPDSKLVGWYRYSPTPGEAGPAIVVGHVDNLTGPAIFWRLRELKIGDVIEVDRADGLTAKFVVTQVTEFPQEDVPIQEVYGNLDYAGLRLITCSGRFNRIKQSYSNNLVIFAKLAE